MNAARFRRGIGGLRRAPLVDGARALVPDPVVSGTRAAVRRYGVATATSRAMPDYLVIGVKKSGTTSLANWLARHPQVLGMIPRWQSAKSPHYFDANFWRGPEWYLSHFPTEAARRRRARALGLPNVVGETSPYYVFHPAAAERIAASAPRVRLVVILREPVSRAYSHYWDRRATGWETLPTFEEALAAEEPRLRGFHEDELRDPHGYDVHHDHHTYVRRGEYAAQLRRYLEHFHRDQLLVLSFDELRDDPVAAFVRVEDFLGLEHAEVGIDLRPHNVRSGYPPIDPATRDRLRAHFAPHNAALEDLLGRSFGW